MPGMNLKFLNNPSQRIATGKSLPLKQLEAIVAYGTAEQRAKVVAKVLPQTYTLSLHKSTHHILATILAHCDNLVRAQMLYHLRRKLNDMARSPVGNLLLQQLLEYLPNMQRKEIAEAFVLNVEEEELETVCKHPFGNHVAQKLLEYPASADVILEKLQPMIQRLVTHPHGQRVVSRLVENVEGGAAAVCKALFPAGGASDDELSSLEDMLQGVEESLVITALLKHPSVDTAVKDSIIACLLEHADDFTALDGGASKRKKPVDGGRPSSSTVSYAEPDFISGASSTPVRAPTARTRNGDADEDLSAANNEEGSKYRHSFAYASAIEFGDDTQRKELYAALKPRLAQFASTKGQTVILLALFKFAETAVSTVQADVMTALFATSGAAASEPVVAATPTPAKKGKKAAAVVVDTDSEDAATVALHPVKSVVLRSVIEVSPDCLSKARVNQLVAAAGTLAVSAVGGPVLQRLVESSSNEVRQAVFNAIKKDIPNLALDGCGSFLLQQLLEHCEGGVKDKVVDAVVECLCEDPCKSLATAQGSRTMQKLIAYASDDVVRKVVDAILEGEEDEGSDAEDEEAEEGAENEEGAEEKPQLSWKEQRLINQKKHYKIRDGRLLSYAVHNHACFAVQALLRECKSRLLQDHRKRLVNSLKPYVFDLAVSPWAGRLVLDSMLTSGSAELKTAIKNVVFMKAESWLSDVPAHAKGQAGIDPTLRRTLRRGRENEGNDGNQKKARSESKSEEAPAAAKKPAKKVFRSLKK